jgi:hypothetical protein
MTSPVTNTLFDGFSEFYEKLTPCFVETSSNRIESLSRFIESLTETQLSRIKGSLLMLVTNGPKMFEPLLVTLRKRNIEIEDTKISAFFKFETSFEDEEDEEIVEEVLETIFKTRYRVPNLYKIFSWHPTYLESMTKLMNTLMWQESPLSMPVRHYLAIIASSRHSCRNIAANHILQFIKVGGNMTWLEGVHRTSCLITFIVHLTHVNSSARNSSHGVSLEIISKSSVFTFFFSRLRHRPTRHFFF